MARAQGLRRTPFVTLTIGLLAVIASCWPAAMTALQYDRQALLAGELWRLLSAPLVHYSASHLGWDLLVFVAAGWAIEAAGDRRFGLLCGLTALIPGIFFLLTAEDLSYYGGLSGLATAAVCYLALRQAATAASGRNLWWGVLILVGLKLAVEATGVQPLFARADVLPFQVLPAAHLIGALVALALHFRPGSVRPQGPVTLPWLASATRKARQRRSANRWP